MRSYAIFVVGEILGLHVTRELLQEPAVLGWTLWSYSSLLFSIIWSSKTKQNRQTNKNKKTQQNQHLND